jgi:hypothetical protein
LLKLPGSQIGKQKMKLFAILIITSEARRRENLCLYKYRWYVIAKNLKIPMNATKATTKKQKYLYSIKRHMQN